MYQFLLIILLMFYKLLSPLVICIKIISKLSKIWMQVVWKYLIFISERPVSTRSEPESSYAIAFINPFVVTYIKSVCLVIKNEKKKKIFAKWIQKYFHKKKITWKFPPYLFLKVPLACKWLLRCNTGRCHLTTDILFTLDLLTIFFCIIQHSHDIVIVQRTQMCYKLIVLN